MTTLGALAAGGTVTWLLRAALIVLAPSTGAADRVAATLRYAPSAAFASLAVTSLATASRDTGAAVWRYALAAVVTALAARASRNLAVPLVAGVVAVTVLTAI